MSPGQTPSPEIEPLTWQDFAHACGALGTHFPLTLAVSGGGDSMALLILAAEWARASDDTGAFPPFQDGPAVHALTVDHGLRPEAAKEAAHVGEVAARLGVPHTILRCEGTFQEGNLQAEARLARYRLMEAWARDHQRPTLLTAHTLEDQAETFLLRLARGSGVDGLSSMAARSLLTDPTGRASIALVRPLLSVSRERLRATCRAAGVAWMEDPSNEDARFARVRMRRLAGELAREGLTAERLAGTAAGMARAREALDAASQTLLQVAVTSHEAGFAVLDRDLLARVPEEVGLRALAALLQQVGGGRYRPRLKSLERLYGRICAHGLEAARTLAGCTVRPFQPPHGLLVARETRHLPEPLPISGGDFRLWDERFRVSLAPGAVPGEVRPLGVGGFRLMREAGHRARATIPLAARASLPALWRGGHLAAVPHLNFDPERSGFRATFIGFERRAAPGAGILADPRDE